MLYLYNTEPDDVVHGTYGSDIHASYLEEKSKLAARHHFAFWGQLDPDHQEQLVNSAIRKYRGQA